MGEILAAELAHQNITVNTLAPHYFPSDMTKGVISAQGYDNLAKEVPLGRLGLDSDIAGACLYLSSRAGAFVNGVVLPLDGGVLVKPPSSM
jgi:NAD(P)-dependent dehydrogenase (short-subunit alcohol dehydrogenase family)